ncbi:MAG: leucyl/phenylalanyl-tRNA--protein transferase [Cycloclasticus sp.]|nr:leucyl/phenylalanyl-tRNA--protein transferase [Cycloclasticus sp.]
MLPWLNPDDDSTAFPPLGSALDDPNGLLAAGGCLSPARLLNAYQHGIFPWFEDNQPILWWSPNPRIVLAPSELHVSRSLRKLINKEQFTCTFDSAFTQVITHCAESRDGQHGTWITSSMVDAYVELFKQGHAHSIEVWDEEKLIGGLYGLSIGQVFFGESMFSRQSNASKVGFAFLCEQLNNWGFKLIDCQVESEHLSSLGATIMPRDKFSERLESLCVERPSTDAWLT